MKTLETLAVEYSANQQDSKAIRILLSLGIVHPEVNDFINRYKDGWVGINGEFARILCVALMATHTL